ncbi:MAG TPA: DUF4350 domain-containing protein [Polyangia bacterium]
MAERGRFIDGARALLLVLGIGCGILVVLVIGPGRRKEGSGAAGSTFATSDRGTKAAYLLLGRLGHPVERRVVPLGHLGDKRLAFLLSPDSRIDDIDVPGLSEWLESGGTLVFGADPFNPAEKLLLQSLDLEGVRVAATSGATAELASDWTPARVLSVRATVAGGVALDEDAVIARVGGTPAAVRIRRGEGAIYVIDMRVFSNEGLKAADNAVFLAALAARHAGGAPIAFDEYAHGFGNPTSLLTMTAWPLRVAFGVAALALGIYALAIGRRLGRPSPEPQPPRRASIEQIEALAAYFAVDGDRQTALVALAAFVGKPVPSPPPRDDRALLLAAQSLVGRASSHTSSNPRSRSKEPEWPSTGSTPPPHE